MEQENFQKHQEVPEDIELNEAGHNWLFQQREQGNQKDARRLASDAHVRMKMMQGY